MLSQTMNELRYILIPHFWGQSLFSPWQPNTAFLHVVSWKRKHSLKNNSIICDPPQDFDAQGESTLTTSFHFKAKEFLLTRFSTLEAIKREEVEQKSVLKFVNNSLRAKLRNLLSGCAKAHKACYLERQYCSKVPETFFSFNF